MLQIDGRYRDDPIAFDLNGGGLAAQVLGQAARIDLRLQQHHHGGHGDLWLEGKARHPTVAGIEVGTRPGGTGVRSVMVAYGVAQPVVAGRAAKAFDMIVFVEGRYALGGQLPADPVRFLGEVLTPATPGRRQRGSNPAGPTPDDEDVARNRARRRQIRDGHDSA